MAQRVQFQTGWIHCFGETEYHGTVGTLLAAHMWC